MINSATATPEGVDDGIPTKERRTALNLLCNVINNAFHKPWLAYKNQVRILEKKRKLSKLRRKGDKSELAEEIINILDRDGATNHQ